MLPSLSGTASARSLAGREVAHLDGVEFGPLGVGAPRQEAMIVSGRGIAEFKVVEALGQRVAVEEQSFATTAPRDAAHEFVLPPFPVARVIFERPVRNRYVGVLLLDAAAHLDLETLLERLRRGHHVVGVAVLGVEQVADGARQLARIAEHLAPVVGAHPGVVVCDLDAVHGAACGPHRDRLGSVRQQHAEVGPLAHRCRLNRASTRASRPPR